MSCEELIRIPGRRGRREKESEREGGREKERREGKKDGIKRGKRGKEKEEEKESLPTVNQFFDFLVLRMELRAPALSLATYQPLFPWQFCHFVFVLRQAWLCNLHWPHIGDSPACWAATAGFGIPKVCLQGSKPICHLLSWSCTFKPSLKPAEVWNQDHIWDCPQACRHNGGPRSPGSC